MATSHKVCIDFSEPMPQIAQMLCTQTHTFFFFLLSSLMYLLSKLISREQGEEHVCAMTAVECQVAGEKEADPRI